MKAKENHMWNSINEISCGHGRKDQEVLDSNSLKLDSDLICLEMSESKIQTNSGIQEMDSNQRCNLCEGHEHCVGNCPILWQKNWRHLESKFTMTTPDQDFCKLSDNFEKVDEYNRPHPSAIEQQRNFVNKLNEFFQKHFPGSHLEIFGSSANGFESISSDLDITLLFSPDSEEASYTSKRKKTDAIHNTHLLKEYNNYEPRLRNLYLVVKNVLKSSRNRQSSEGGISSYGYLLMLIFYLQQKGYLLCLQEVYEGVEKPEIIVDTWNVWFQKDREVVNKIWKPPTDGKTVAELYIGFLKFYLFEFDRNSYQVTIDSLKLIKHTNQTRCLAIIDPFDKSHNLTKKTKPEIIVKLLTTFYNALVYHNGNMDIKFSHINEFLTYPTRLEEKLDPNLFIHTET
ncbi:hypothetical protein ACTXT7_013839 [Hymenolepis weldensis]